MTSQTDPILLNRLTEFLCRKPLQWFASLAILGTLIFVAAAPADDSEGARRPAVVGKVASDPFGRLRGTSRGAGLDAWYRVGAQLSGLKTLEGAVYDSQTGELMLIGTPAKQRGPYHLDDLMVVLKSVYSSNQPLGMTIDPDPAAPRGPTMNVRYFGGCENTGCGWVMFECDRLLKCLSQGEDNFTGKSLKPDVPEFYNMLELASLSAKQPDNLWNRFWLTVDREGGQPWYEEPRQSNGSQPIVFETRDRLTMRIKRCRMFVRTEVMRWEGEKLVPAEGMQDPASERFAKHFSMNFDKFAELYPEFARLEALSRLMILGDWIERAEIPLDFELISSYRQQVVVLTPDQTPARTSRRKTERRTPDGIEVQETGIYGGVDLKTNAFFLPDAAAARLAEEIKGSVPSDASRWNWEVTTDDGPRHVVALPGPQVTLAEQVSSRNGVELRPAETPADLAKVQVARSERQQPLVARANMSLATLDQLRERARGPPERLVELDPLQIVLADERHLAVDQRTTVVGRERIKLHLDRIDKANQTRGPPLERSQRSTGVKREPIPLKFPLGLPLFETTSGQATFNLPKVQTPPNPKRQPYLVDAARPDEKYFYPSQLTIRSEIRDIAIQFGEPEFDPVRRQVFLKPASDAPAGILGYYPNTSRLEFKDGTRIQFNKAGLPAFIQMPQGDAVNFVYDPQNPNAAHPLGCVVTSSEAPQLSGYYELSSMFAKNAVEQRQAAYSLVDLGFHRWTRIGGKTFDAILLRVQNDQATMKTRQGKIGSLPLQWLIPSDRDYAAQWERTVAPSPAAQPAATP